MQRALREYAATSKRELAVIVNQKAYSILLKAAGVNRVADKAKIQAELGQQATAIRGQKVRFLKDGSIKRGRIITEKIYTSALYAIVLWKARKKGRVIKSSELEGEAKRELGRRLAAVSYMKSGWFAALEPIARAIGKPLKKGNLRRAGKAKGGGKAAKWFGYRTFVSFFNTSFNKPENTTDPNPTRWAEQALEYGLNQETATMRDRLAKKLAAQAKRQGSLG